MKDLAALIYFLIYLYSAGIDTSNPVFVQNVINDIQIRGIETAIDRFETDLPDLLAESGIEIPDKSTSETSDNNDDNTGNNNENQDAGTGDTIEEQDQNTGNNNETPVIDPYTLDYKQELIKLGYYNDNDKSDANLKPEDTEAILLRNAVLRFQSSCNLVADGIWGKKSQAALLLKLTTKADPFIDVIAAPPSEGKWIVINKTKRILTLYEGSKVIKKYPIAVGRRPSYTPEDKFFVFSKVINPAWGGGGYAKPVKGGIPENPLGYRWLGLSYKDGKTLGIHGNNEPDSIGKNISHGCIRMINTDVEQLFKTVTTSIPVWIGSEEKLKEWGLFQLDYSEAAKL